MSWIAKLLRIGFLVSTSLTPKAYSAAFPLHTEGRSLVGSDGQPVHLKAVNWYGANLETHVARGLEQKTPKEIAQLIRELGYNSVRLTFSNAMLHDPKPVNPADIRANPSFQGMTPLEVFDETVKALASENLAVMLNNHSTSSVWCCGYDTDGLWHFGGTTTGLYQSEQQWIDDWKMLVARYRHIPEVVAADLRNEVRTAKWGDSILPLSPGWGSGDENDWARAAERAGNEVLSVNPSMLVIVEGINWTGTLGMFGGYRPHLQGVLHRPIQLNVPGRLVYAAHNYGYIGPKHNGDNNTSPGQITYSGMDEQTFYDTLEREWGYVVEQGQFYTAPLIVSEFGVGHEASETDRIWFKRLTNFIVRKNLHFAYWPLNPEGYGLVDNNWEKQRDWREGDLNRLLAIEPKVFEAAPKFANLNIQNGDHQLTGRFGDWYTGANKGTCEEGTRLVGLSQDHRALCTNKGRTSEWADRHVVIRSETASIDWAGGFTKYTCPENTMVAGYSKHWWGTSGVLCVQPQTQLGNSCRTLWFDRGDNLSDGAAGDFANGSHKGQCANDEYLSGIAQKNGRASALLCCR